MYIVTALLPCSWGTRHNFEGRIDTDDEHDYYTFNHLNSNYYYEKIVGLGTGGEGDLCRLRLDLSVPSGTNARKLDLSEVLISVSVNVLIKAQLSCSDSKSHNFVGSSKDGQEYFKITSDHGHFGSTSYYYEKIKGLEAGGDNNGCHLRLDLSPPPEIINASEMRSAPAPAPIPIPIPEFS